MLTADVPTVTNLRLIFAQKLIKAGNVRLFYLLSSSLKSALSHRLGFPGQQLRCLAWARPMTFTWIIPAGDWQEADTQDRSPVHPRTHPHHPLTEGRFRASGPPNLP